jgi:hypothetical protein
VETNKKFQTFEMLSLCLSKIGNELFFYTMKGGDCIGFHKRAKSKNFGTI